MHDNPLNTSFGVVGGTRFDKPAIASKTGQWTDANQHFVASLHPWMYWASAVVIKRSMTRIATEVMTTAFAVERPTPSAPAPVM